MEWTERQADAEYVTYCEESRLVDLHDAHVECYCEFWLSK